MMPMWEEDVGYNPDIHHRRSIRLRNYEYSRGGAYFVTVCVHGRECLFGGIRDGVMVLNEAGIAVQDILAGLPERFPNVSLDDFTIMPNHFHGIIQIHDVGAGSPRPDYKIGYMENGGETLGHQDKGVMTAGHQDKGGETPPLPKPTLGQVIGYFKYQSTKQINIIRDNPGVPVWQRNYYERVIRNDAELAGIREYIRHNPQQWPDDEENPCRGGVSPPKT